MFKVEVSGIKLNGNDCEVTHETKEIDFYGVYKRGVNGLAQWVSDHKTRKAALIKANKLLRKAKGLS